MHQPTLRLSFQVLQNNEIPCGTSVNSFPQNERLVTLRSTIYTHYQIHINKIKQKEKKGKNIKAIWVEGNPFENDHEDYFKFLLENFPQIELINRKFTLNSTDWIVKYLPTYQMPLKPLDYYPIYHSHLKFFLSFRSFVYFFVYFKRSCICLYSKILVYLFYRISFYVI